MAIFTTENNSGSRNHNWKGGVTIDKYGYRLILKKGHPMSNSKGYVPEHRFLMSQHLYRVLDSTEIVHHINENKLDNRLENLELLSPFKHKSIHGKMIGKKIPRKFIRVCVKCQTQYIGGFMSKWCSNCRIGICATCHKRYKKYPSSIGIKSQFCSQRCYH